MKLAMLLFAAMLLKHAADQTHYLSTIATRIQERCHAVE